MLLSIIIPVYNGAGKIEKCLDSIYSQGLNFNDFEVICVDDKSPLSSSVEALSNYKYATGESEVSEIKPPNLIIIENIENIRQGGARNEGVKIAKGDYIQFIDQDDVFLPGALSKIISCIGEFKPIDMMMFDHSLSKNGQLKPKQYSHNSPGIYSGLDFFKKNEFTWAPWGYLYRREFLLNNHLRFVEKVQFEDVDFVIDCIRHAKSICFIDFASILYTHNEDSQTNIGNDSFEKIDFMGQLMNRVRNLSHEIRKSDEDAAEIVRRHYIAGFKIMSYRLIWVNFKDKRGIINKWLKGGFKDEDDRYLSLFSQWPTLSALLLQIAGPFLRYKIRKKRGK